MIPERDKPSHCYESGCPLAETGKRFVLGCGDPRTAKIAICLEAPGHEEIAFTLKPEKGRKFYGTKEECDAEIAIRARDYPGLERRFLSTGVAVVGRSGFELTQWALPAAGLARSELFIDNTLRCLPPKHGDSHYPQGNARKKAEACCRHYDRWSEFSPDVAIVSIHPAAIVREPAPLWLQIHNFKKAHDFARAGLRVLVLAGGKAVKWFLGYGENVTKWQSHFEYNTPASQERRADRLRAYELVNPGETGHGKRTHIAEEDAGQNESSTKRTGRRRADAVEILFGE